MANDQDRPFNDPQHPSWSTPVGGQQQPGQDGRAVPPAPGWASGGQYPGPGGQAPRNPYADQAPPSAAPQPAFGYAPAEPKTLSIISLVCGIVGLISFGTLFAPQIAAIVTGHIALRREPSGRGMAIAGLVMGYLVLGLGLLFGFLAAALFASYVP
ncbi:DUF4190 domain-containing protein [Zafaria sp. Z1313]|uniref:DUF4190 domain-containing protein n=1 Tax=unclassified Zafaria TaxID=2828765 RepID=UPI002E7929FE|nr:DUF4190 domain-containing protein [Zafaria sp. J156]MEE1621425.1 DUF4190 domain-containing protein [Zafaria sp. J156]